MNIEKLQRVNLIILQSELAGQKEGLAGLHIKGIGDGCNDDVVKRIGDDQHDERHQGDQDHIAGLVGHAGEIILLVHVSPSLRQS